MDIHELKTRIEALLSSCGNGIPNDQLHGMLECSEAGECEIAFESFCSQLYEYDLSISEQSYDELKSLGIAMGIDASYWEILSRK